jgi:hypothetical protein
VIRSSTTPTARFQLADVRVVGGLVALQRQVANGLFDRGALALGARCRKACERDDRVPLARDALVQLDEHLHERGLLGSQAHDRLHEVVDRVEVLGADGMGDALLGEEPAAAGLRAEREVLRVGARTSGSRAPTARSRSRSVVL